MELLDYIRVLWNRKWVIILTPILTLAVAYLGASQITPRYTAETTLRILTATGGDIDFVQYNLEYTDRLMNTLAEIATSGPLTEQVMQELNLTEEPEITADIISNSEVFLLSVTYSYPDQAADIANALAETIIAQNEELTQGNSRAVRAALKARVDENEAELNTLEDEYDALLAAWPQDAERLAELEQIIPIRRNSYLDLLGQYERVRATEAIRANVISVIEPALPPEAPSSPNMKLILGLSSILGLAAGTGLAFLFENLDSRLRTPRAVAEFARAPILAQIPRSKGKKHVHISNSNSIQEEAYRRLRARLFLLHSDMDNASDGSRSKSRKSIAELDRTQELVAYIGETPISLKTILIAGAAPAEGKSTVAANLATVLAKTGRKVLLVDSDLVAPDLHDVFETENEVGLSTVLLREDTLDEALQKIPDYPNLSFLPSGPKPTNSSDLLGLPQTKTVLEELHHSFDFILLDSPAALAVTDASVLARIVDGVILVVNVRKAHHQGLSTVLNQLESVGANLLGLVLTGVKPNTDYVYYKRYLN